MASNRSSTTTLAFVRFDRLLSGYRLPDLECSLKKLGIKKMVSQTTSGQLFRHITRPRQDVVLAMNTSMVVLQRKSLLNSDAIYDFLFNSN
jgi:hypothetical protein